MGIGVLASEEDMVVFHIKGMFRAVTRTCLVTAH